MKISGLIIPLALTLLIAAQSLLFGGVFSDNDDYSELFKDQDYLTLAVLKGDVQLNTNNIKISSPEHETKQISYKNQWDGGVIQAVLEKNFKFSESVAQHEKQTMIKAALGHKMVDLPYNRRVIKLNDSRNRVKVSYLLDDKLQTDLEIKVPKNYMDMDLLSIYLQGFLSSGKTKRFTCDVLLPDMKRTLNVSITHKTTQNIGRFTPEYSVPVEIQNLSLFEKPVNVFIIEATGLPRMFYPHKFYLFFDNTFPFNLLAWWGGPPNEAVFYVSKLLIKPS